MDSSTGNTKLRTAPLPPANKLPPIRCERHTPSAGKAGEAQKRSTTRGIPNGDRALELACGDPLSIRAVGGADDDAGVPAQDHKLLSPGRSSDSGCAIGADRHGRPSWCCWA